MIRAQILGVVIHFQGFWLEYWVWCYQVWCSGGEGEEEREYVREIQRLRARVGRIERF